MTANWGIMSYNFYFAWEVRKLIAKNSNNFFKTWILRLLFPNSTNTTVQTTFIPCSIPYWSFIFIHFSIKFMCYEQGLFLTCMCSKCVQNWFLAIDNNNNNNNNNDNNDNNNNNNQYWYRVNHFSCATAINCYQYGPSCNMDFWGNSLKY